MKPEVDPLRIFYNFAHLFCFFFLGKLLKCAFCTNMESGLITYHDPFSHLAEKQGKKSRGENGTRAKKTQKTIIMCLFVIKKTKPIMMTELRPARKTLLHFENDVFSNNTQPSILVILMWPHLAFKHVQGLFLFLVSHNWIFLSDYYRVHQLIDSLSLTRTHASCDLWWSQGATVRLQILTGPLFFCFCVIRTDSDDGVNCFSLLLTNCKIPPFPFPFSVWFYFTFASDWVLKLCRCLTQTTICPLSESAWFVVLARRRLGMSGLCCFDRVYKWSERVRQESWCEEEEGRWTSQWCITGPRQTSSDHQRATTTAAAVEQQQQAAVWQPAWNDDQKISAVSNCVCLFVWVRLIDDSDRYW